MVFDSPPIVATNGNAGNPHFEPRADSPTPIRRGDLLLIDFWAKEPGADSVYADYTQMAVVDSAPSAEHARIFAIVARARDAAIAAVRAAVGSAAPVRGCDIDDVAREVIAGAGFGEAFVHRTGHSIGREVHGEGANIDNFETHDERLLLPWTCFSIEPGIYLPRQEMGFRSEVDVVILDGAIEVSGEIQARIEPLLA
jgi:Xaa-Pro aminopeptidase